MIHKKKLVNLQLVDLEQFTRKTLIVDFPINIVSNMLSKIQIVRTWPI